MFVIKLKFKNSHTIKYCNNYVIEDVIVIKRDTANFPLKHFTMSLPEATKLYRMLITRYKNPADGFFNTEAAEYISIVELSNYAPYSEYAVLEYYDKFP